MVCWKSTEESERDQGVNLYIQNLDYRFDNEKLRVADFVTITSCKVSWI